MAETKIVFLDTETTGNDVATDRLCQVCYKADGVMHVQNFKPPIPISTKAMSITHITNKMVEGEDAFIGSTFAADLAKTLDEGVLVAHNARFDIAILKAEGIDVPRHICTLRLVRYLDPDQEITEYNLQYLRYHYGVEVAADAHSAEGDVLVLEAVFDHLYALAAQKSKTDSREEIIERMIDISMTPSLIRRFTFGKYNGELVADVATRDRGYLEWFLKTKLADDPDDEDWIHTLRKALGQ
jgi:exodeoxyribonuclease X